MDLGYVWDEDKYRKVQQKHSVSFHEVVDALEDPNGFEYSDDASLLSERWLWIGQTQNGRILLIVYSEEDLPLLRIITAFDAEHRWADEYKQRQRP